MYDEKGVEFLDYSENLKSIVEEVKMRSKKFNENLLKTQQLWEIVDQLIIQNPELKDDVEKLSELVDREWEEEQIKSIKRLNKPLKPFNAYEGQIPNNKREEEQIENESEFTKYKDDSETDR